MGFLNVSDRAQKYMKPFAKTLCPVFFNRFHRLWIPLVFVMPTEGLLRFLAESAHPPSLCILFHLAISVSHNSILFASWGLLRTSNKYFAFEREEFFMPKWVTLNVTFLFWGDLGILIGATTEKEVNLF